MRFNGKTQKHIRIRENKGEIETGKFVGKTLVERNKFVGKRKR